MLSFITKLPFENAEREKTKCLQKDRRSSDGCPFASASCFCLKVLLRPMFVKGGEEKLKQYAEQGQDRECVSWCVFFIAQNKNNI